MTLAQLFGHRHIFRITIFLALLFCLPMLTNGLFLDDYQQRLTMLTSPGSNIFDFFTRGNPVTEAQIQSGILPWWTWDDAKIRFFRPIGQFMTWLDYQLWPDNFVLMHLHSVLWYLLLVAVVAMTYRQLMPIRWAAGLAAMLFALDYGHAGGVVWLCNRSVIIAMLLSLACLYCHRRDTTSFRLVAACLFALSLAAAEAALAITGYLLAHELFLTARSHWQRLVRLLPYVLIALLWIGFWHKHGYGVSGPGFYIDIASQPLLFMEKVIYRAPAYLVGQFALPPAEVFGAVELLPELSTAQLLAVIYAVGILTLLFVFFWPLLKHSALARFYALGLLIAVLPICASSLVSRSLWYVSFGAAGLIALYVANYRELVSGKASLSRARIFASGLLGIHLVLSPMLFLLLPKVADMLDVAMDSRTVHLPVSNAEQPQVLLLTSLSYVGNVTFPMLKDHALSMGKSPLRQTPVITRIRGLVEGKGQFTLQRPSNNTLIATAADAFTAMASPTYGFRAGHQVILDDVKMTVTRVNANGQPVQIRYDFAPGVLARYTVMAWQDDRFKPAQLPLQGQALNLRLE
jgi:hypothetical protein